MKNSLFSDNYIKYNLTCQLVILLISPGAFAHLQGAQGCPAGDTSVPQVSIRKM
jgi:hypothetical protein